MVLNLISILFLSGEKACVQWMNKILFFFSMRKKINVHFEVTL